MLLLRREKEEFGILNLFSYESRSKRSSVQNCLRIPEVPISSLPTYRLWTFVSVLSPYQIHSGTVPYIGTWQFLFTSFPIHHSQTSYHLTLRS